MATKNHPFLLKKKRLVEKKFIENEDIVIFLSLNIN